MIPRLAKRAVALLAAGYIAAAGYMGFNQRAFIFPAEPASPVLANAGLPRAVETTVMVTDGTRLTGWQIEPLRADAPVFVYFHGIVDYLITNYLVTVFFEVIIHLPLFAKVFFFFFYFCVF